MTFTEAKQQFDVQYGNSYEFTNFLPEHLTLNKKTPTRNKYPDCNAIFL